MPRSDILDSPSSKPTLKPDVRRKLDEIASLTYAHIAVVNSPLSLSSRTPPDGISTSAGWTGLETERVCELVVTGQGDATELARVRLLVMLDELVRHPVFSSSSVPHSIHRAVCIQNLAKSTKSYMPSSPVVNVMSFSPSKRIPPPISIILPLSRVSLVPILSRPRPAPMVIPLPVRLKGVNINRLTIRTSYGSLASFLAFREPETCCFSFLQTRFVRFVRVVSPPNPVVHRVRVSSLVIPSSFPASSIGWSLIAQRTSSLSCPTTRLLSSSRPLAVRRA